jgi:uncharacterized protein
MKTSKLTVVLDTNVLLVALPLRSPYRLIWDQLLLESYELVISNEILAEYEEQLAERYDPQTIQDVFGVLFTLPNVQRVTPYFRWQLIVNDPDDDKFVDATIAANALYLVSNDHHFDVLKTVAFPRVNVCAAQDFREILKNL